MPLDEYDEEIKAIEPDKERMKMKKWMIIAIVIVLIIGIAAAYEMLKPKAKPAGLVPGGEAPGF